MINENLSLEEFTRDWCEDHIELFSGYRKNWDQLKEIVSKFEEMTELDGNDVDNVTSDVIFRYWSQMEIDVPSEDPPKSDSIKETNLEGNCNATIWNKDDEEMNNGIGRNFDSIEDAINQILDYHKNVQKIRAINLEKNDTILFSWTEDDGKKLEDSVKELNL